MISVYLLVLSFKEYLRAHGVLEFRIKSLALLCIPKVNVLNLKLYQQGKLLVIYSGTRVCGGGRGSFQSYRPACGAVDC